MDPLRPKCVTQTLQMGPLSPYESLAMVHNNIASFIHPEPRSYNWSDALGKLERLLTESPSRDVTGAIAELFHATTDPNEKLLVTLAVADLLGRRQRFSEALSVILENSHWPGSEDLRLWLNSVKVRLYLQLHQPEQAWAVTESLLPQPSQERPQDVGVFLQWLTGMMELNQWSRWREMKPRLEQFLAKAVQEEPVLILSALQKTYSAYLNMGCLRETKLVQQLALYAARRMQHVRAPFGLSDGQAWTTRRSQLALRSDKSLHSSLHAGSTNHSRPAPIVRLETLRGNRNPVRQRPRRPAGPK